MEVPHSDSKFLGTVNIKRGIFHGDSFSPFLFVIAFIPVTRVLRETGVGYQLEDGALINHLFFMDGQKISGKNGFLDFEMCVVSLKEREMCEGVKLPNGKRWVNRMLMDINIWSWIRYCARR